MKKYILLFLLLFLIPFVTYGESCDTSLVSVSSISLEKSSDDVAEIKDATINGKSISLNMNMFEVGDIAKYKIVVKNESKNDFELDSDFIVNDSKYIEYKLESDDKSNIIKGNSSKVLYVSIEYKEEIPEEMFKNGKYVVKKDMSVNLSAKGDIDNPKTGASLRLVLICIIVIFIIGLISFIMVKKRIPMKAIVFIGVGISLIPLTIYAICKCEVTIESVVEIVDKDFILCKRAKTLKTEECTNYDYGGQCYYAGYYSEGSMGTSTITFGNLGTPGKLNTGDAFICDVNKDREWDEDNERFYYVTDYYDTINNKFDETVATMIYDANMTNGVRDITTFNAYSATDSALEGPTEGVKHLPKTTSWSKTKLKNSKRQIRTIEGKTQVDGHNLPVFDYGNSAARLLTWQEINRACNLTNENLSEWSIWPQKCEYMFSNLAYSNRNNRAFSFFTETTASSTEVWMVYSFSRRMFEIEANDGNTRGIRPVIDVPKERIIYD